MFFSIFPCLTPACESGLVFHPRLFPAHLGSFSSPFVCPGVMFHPSSRDHVILALSLKYQRRYYGRQQPFVFPTDHYIKCTLHCLMHSPLPCLLASKDTGSSGCPGNPANCCSSLKKLKPVLTLLPSQSSYSHGPALLCLIGVPRVGNLPDGGKSKGKWRRSL